MSRLRVRYQTIEFGDEDIHVRTLRDTQEFADADGEAEALGIFSAMWPLFGVVWGAGHALARLMAGYEVDDLRVLEVGCGIGLASLVLNRRAVDITATDHHPEAGRFLQANTELNGDADIPFVRTGWTDEDSGLGRFDLIIASDVLYEGGNTAALAAFIDAHARPDCEVLVVDPGRGHTGRFAKAMQGNGYAYTRTAAEIPLEPHAPFTGFVHRFVRAAPSAPGG